MAAMAYSGSLACLSVVGGDNRLQKRGLVMDVDGDVETRAFALVG